MCNAIWVEIAVNHTHTKNMNHGIFWSNLKIQKRSIRPH